jgi:hypothetical protein
LTVAHKKRVNKLPTFPVTTLWLPIGANTVKKPLRHHEP